MKKQQPVVVKQKLSSYQLQKNEINMLLTYMDYHLTLLFDGLKEDNQKDIKFQKEQLEKVRERLFELRYFR